MKTSVTLFAVLAMTGAASAYAFGPGKNGPFDGARTPPSIEEMADRQAERFMKMDLNQDGQVSREEIEEFRAQMREKRSGERADRFAKADANGDGLVSQMEMKAAAKAPTVTAFCRERRPVKPLVARVCPRMPRLNRKRR